MFLIGAQSYEVEPPQILVYSSVDQILLEPSYFVFIIASNQEFYFVERKIKEDVALRI